MVSIHLMLLFITEKGVNKTTAFTFQYISCCYLFVCSGRYFWCECVSIHLMLLFILFAGAFKAHHRFGFNTSHVVIYRLCLCRSEHCRHVSIHLMLLFIPVCPCAISRRKCFNTSHVVIYRLQTFLASFLSLFQYISCCYLSLLYKSHHYTLSSFNTSHVVIYHVENNYCNGINISFNTSHVVIYLLRNRKSSVSTQVSIHLMLLFISDKYFPGPFRCMFQYISCCYLSC